MKQNIASETSIALETEDKLVCELSKNDRLVITYNGLRKIDIIFLPFTEDNSRNFSHKRSNKMKKVNSKIFIKFFMCCASFKHQKCNTYLTLTFIEY